MLKICELTVADEIYWDEYVTNSLTATPYHLSAWKKVVEKSFGHKPYYILSEMRKELLAFFPAF